MRAALHASSASCEQHLPLLSVGLPRRARRNLEELLVVEAGRQQLQQLTAAGAQADDVAMLQQARAGGWVDASAVRRLLTGGEEG